MPAKRLPDAEPEIRSATARSASFVEHLYPLGGRRTRSTDGSLRRFRRWFSVGRVLLVGMACLMLPNGPLAGGQPSDDVEEPPAEAPAATFKIIMNAANPTVALERSKIARMFRKKLFVWENGERVQAVDLPRESPARKEFTEAIHQKSVTMIERYWQQMIFSGKGHPPDKVETEAEVIEFIEQRPGGIGYVSAEIELPSTVKELQVLEEP